MVAGFDWALWRKSIAADLQQLSYPNADVQQYWLRQAGINRAALQPAAVMVLIDALVPQQVILTVRSWHLSHHSGQVSFAGGKQDASDADIVATALRETKEELGIDQPQIEIIGQMPPLLTVSAFEVHPVIGVLTDKTPLQPNRDEVARVFTVPLAELMRPERYQSMPFKRGQQVFQTVQFPHHEHIWGATATILLALAQHYQASIHEHHYGF